MCQLIAKPAGQIIGKKVLKRAWRDNHDGGGYAYRDAKTNKVFFAKGFVTFPEFWKSYRQYADNDCLIHFRFATHGLEDETNTHPFLIGDGSVMGHNGILSMFLPGPIDKRSDTRVFLEDYLAPAIKNSKLSAYEFLESPAKAFIEKLIGSNKLLALTPEGFSFVNERLGEWKDGSWFSAGYPSTFKDYCYGYLDKGYSFAPRGGYAYVDADGDWIEDTDEEEVLEKEDECCMCQEEIYDRNYQVGADLLCEECWANYMTC